MKQAITNENYSKVASVCAVMQGWYQVEGQLMLSFCGLLKLISFVQCTWSIKTGYTSTIRIDGHLKPDGRKY